jgi:hypothetical protein
MTACPTCRHAAHSGTCLNAASDGDCSCPGPYVDRLVARHVCTCPSGLAYEGPQEDCEVHGEDRALLIQVRDRLRDERDRAERRVAELEDQRNEALATIDRLADEKLTGLHTSFRALREECDQAWRFATYGEAFGDGQEEQRQSPWQAELIPHPIFPSDPPTVRLTYAAREPVVEERALDGVVAGVFGSSGQGYEPARAEDGEAEDTCDSPDCGQCAPDLGEPHVVVDEAQRLSEVDCRNGHHSWTESGHGPCSVCDLPASPPVLPEETPQEHAGILAPGGYCQPSQSEPDTVTLRTPRGGIRYGEPVATQPDEPEVLVLRSHHDPYGGLAWWESKPVPPHLPGDLIELVDDGQHQRFRVSRRHESPDGVREWRVVTVGPAHDTPTLYGPTGWGDPVRHDDGSVSVPAPAGWRIDDCHLVPSQAEFRVSGNRFGTPPASAYGYGQLPRPIVLGEFAPCPQTNPHPSHQLSQPDPHGWRAWCVGQEHGTLVLAQGDEPPTDLAEAAAWLNRHQDDLDRAVRAAEARRHARGWRRLRGWR